jgi:hypothetical protein
MNAVLLSLSLAESPVKPFCRGELIESTEVSRRTIGRKNCDQYRVSGSGSNAPIDKPMTFIYCRALF